MCKIKAIGENVPTTYMSIISYVREAKRGVVTVEDVVQWESQHLVLRCSRSDRPLLALRSDSVGARLLSSTCRTRTHKPFFLHARQFFCFFFLVFMEKTIKPPVFTAGRLYPFSRCSPQSSYSREAFYTGLFAKRNRKPDIYLNQSPILFRLYFSSNRLLSYTNSVYAHGRIYK